MHRPLPSRSTWRFGASLLVLAALSGAVAFAPLLDAHAQSAQPVQPKASAKPPAPKGSSPATSASAPSAKATGKASGAVPQATPATSTSAQPAASTTPPASSGSAPAAAPSTAPTTPTSADSDTKGAASAGGAGVRVATVQGSSVNPHDPTEAHDTWYYFVGARYRGAVLPQFMLNIGVSEGRTVFTNTVGAEFELRKNNFSIIPAIAFTELGMPDTLFLEKGKSDAVPGNWSLVGSRMKGIFLSADFLWSVKLNKMLDFEFGGGIGFGTMFDTLRVNWVYEDPNGPYKSEGGRSFSACQVGDDLRSDRAGCTTRDHSFAKVARVGGYEEASWFNGGSKPSFLPQLTLPNLGVRIKPMREFAGRVQVGFSITGFWFGISGSYGFPGRKAAPKPKQNVEVEETVE